MLYSKVFLYLTGNQLCQSHISSSSHGKNGRFFDFLIISVISCRQHHLSSLWTFRLEVFQAGKSLKVFEQLFQRSERAGRGSGTRCDRPGCRCGRSRRPRTRRPDSGAGTRWR